MAAQRAPSSKIELRVLTGHHTASVRQDVARDDIPESIGRSFQLVREALGAQGIAPEGAPFVRYHTFGDVVDLEAGMMVASPIQPRGEVKPGQLPAGPAAIAVHAGPYESLAATYDAMERWLAASPHQPNGGPWELYITDPSAEPDPAKWLTEVIFPLRRSADNA